MVAAIAWRVRDRLNSQAEPPGSEPHRTPSVVFPKSVE